MKWNKWIKGELPNHLEDIFVVNILREYNCGPIPAYFDRQSGHFMPRNTSIAFPLEVTHWSESPDYPED